MKSDDFGVNSCSDIVF